MAKILERKEYLGHTVNFKCTTKSYKCKKRIDIPEDQQAIFENTHEAIIDQESLIGCRSSERAGVDPVNWMAKWDCSPASFSVPTVVGRCTITEVQPGRKSKSAMFVGM